MSNRVTENIDGREYNIIAAEEETYVRKVAAHADSQIRAVVQTSKFSSLDGATLACMNIADQYFKEMETSENLRRQLKEFFGGRRQVEAGDLRAEAGDLPSGK